jgi:hypothetical protein
MNLSIGRRGEVTAGGEISSWRHKIVEQYLRQGEPKFFKRKTSFLLLSLARMLLTNKVFPIFMKGE